MQLPIVGSINWKHAAGFALAVLVVIALFNRVAPAPALALVYGGKKAA